MNAFAMKNLFYSFPILLLLAFCASACISTGGIAQDQATSLSNTPTGTMADLLRQQPNLSVSGAGQGVRLQIRGKQTLGGASEPLMVVNGYRLGSGYEVVSHLNPSDVSRINIIRDPNELVAYGIGSANGVVEILLK
jgi:hypothetical protein